MLQITNDYRKKVAAALLEVRSNYDGTDSAFARLWGMNGSIYSRVKGGETENILKDSQWLTIGRKLDVNPNNRIWNMARTDVFNTIEEDVDFCQTYSKSKMYVDDCGIGKTYTAKYLSRTRKNCFYVDASQAKTKHLFTRALAKAIGVDPLGTLAEVKAEVKYYLNILPSPIVIIDEAGDLDYPAFLDLKEYWNGTENSCAWYLMGAEGLREYIDRGIRRRKVGFRELFSRLSERYTSVVPIDPQERLGFYKKLITDVLSVNMPDKSKLNEIVKRCLTRDESGKIGGLRRAESLLILNQ